MDYFETDNKNKKKITSKGIYALIACCLIAIGGAAWFAVAKINGTKEENKNMSSDYDYSSPESSFESLLEEPKKDTDVSKSVAADKSDVPYSSESKVEPSEEKRSFILPADGEIIKGYSESALQYSKTYGDMRLHTGIDIKCEKNAQIKACGQGTLSDIREDSLYGKTAVINHGDGISILYCGLESISKQIGDKVSAGDIIGTAGAVPSECSDGVHIHIAATVDGKVCSPLKALGME